MKDFFKEPTMKDFNEFFGFTGACDDDLISVSGGCGGSAYFGGAPVSYPCCPGGGGADGKAG